MAACYSKSKGMLFVSWTKLLIPIEVVLLYKLAQTGRVLMKFEDIVEETYPDKSQHLTTIKTVFVSYVFALVSLIWAMTTCYFLGDFLDNRDAEPLLGLGELLSLFSLFFAFWAIYSIAVDFIHKNEKEETLASQQSLVSSLVNTIVAVLGRSFVFCAGGQCNSIYIGTITMFFSSLGISVVDIVPYVKKASIILIGISLFSLYSTHKSFTYKPFLLSSLASIVILLDIFDICSNIIMLVLSNVTMIAAAIWDAKVSKPSLLPMYKPKNKE